jgi:hypothetical protein
MSEESAKAQSVPRITFMDAFRLCACASLSCKPQKEEKTTLGWVVNGGRRHAEPQGELIPRCSYVAPTAACLIVVVSGTAA